MEARASEVLVGRGRELGELERALAAAEAGSGTTVLVAGEAGIGKTRLASELASRARHAGFEVLLGRSIDLVGTELPYQPIAEALRPLGEPWLVDGQTPGSQLRVFEETLALLTERAASAPVLLVLEDLHWADTSTLDLVVFLAHNLDDRPVLLLATFRADELSSTERMRRLADGVRRSGSAILLELEPLDHEELAELLTARADGSLPAALTDAIVARSEGNPFFAEELLAAAGEGSVELPEGLRDVLLQRVAGLDRQTESLLRVAAAAGRDVEYSLLCATAALPEPQVRDSLRQAVAHGVLVAEPGTRVFRFRHALLAEAIYATILPGEREELHARLAEGLARSEAATPAELAPHWAAAGRTTEALVASVEAARQAEAVFGLAEALAHLERALALWDVVAGRRRAGWARPRRALHLDRRARQPSRRRRARGRARPASDRGRRRGRPAPCGPPPCAPRRVPLADRPRRRLPRRDRARGRARAGGATLAGARIFASVARRGVGGGLAPCGVAARSANRRSRSLGMSAHARRRSERSRCSAATLPISGAATRVSPIFVRPCSSPRRSVIASAWSEHGSISPMC